MNVSLTIRLKAVQKCIDERVEVGRLDDMVHGRISFVKMDIEGSEYRAFGEAKVSYQSISYT